MGQAVACSPVTQRTRIRSPVWTSFLGEVFSGFFLTCKTNIGKPQAPMVPEYHLAIIVIIIRLIIIHYVHRCVASGSMRACHAAGPGSIPGRGRMSGSFRPTRSPNIIWPSLLSIIISLRAPMTLDVDAPLNPNIAYIQVNLVPNKPIHLLQIMGG